MERGLGSRVSMAERIKLLSNKDVYVAIYMTILFQWSQICDPGEERSDLPWPDGAADWIPQQDLRRRRPLGPHEQVNASY